MIRINYLFAIILPFILISYPSKSDILDEYCSIQNQYTIKGRITACAERRGWVSSYCKTSAEEFNMIYFYCFFQEGQDFEYKYDNFLYKKGEADRRLHSFCSPIACEPTFWQKFKYK